MNISLIIPVKQSSRFPHKNIILAKYTLDWVKQEIANDSENSYTIIGVGDKTELPYDIPFIETPCQSQYEDLLTAEKSSASDVYVLLQLTQPVREKGLLKRTIELFKKNHKTIISGTRMSDNRWRIVDENGVWCPKTDQRVIFHDGVIYAWEAGKLHEVYERETPHDVIISSEILPIIDIDHREDIPADLDILWQYAMNKED